MLKRLTPVRVNNELCFRVKQFAALTNRTTQTIYNLIRDGNSIRKLKTVKVEGTDLIFIPVSELTDFPFTSPGVNSDKHPYHFDDKGEIINE
jgi:hypothetical protein